MTDYLFYKFHKKQVTEGKQNETISLSTFLPDDYFIFSNLQGCTINLLASQHSNTQQNPEHKFAKIKLQQCHKCIVLVSQVFDISEQVDLVDCSDITLVLCAVKNVEQINVQNCTNVTIQLSFGEKQVVPSAFAPIIFQWEKTSNAVVQIVTCASSNASNVQVREQMPIACSSDKFKSQILENVMQYVTAEQDEASNGPKQQEGTTTKPRKKATLPQPVSSNQENPIVQQTVDLSQAKQALKKTKTVVTTMTDVYSEIIEDLAQNNVSGAPTEEELKEYFDDEQTLQEHVNKVAKLMQTAKHVVFYTGAGVSTSANISDYRGSKGVWTLSAKLVATKGTQMEQVFPTYSHYAIAHLIKTGKAHYLTSTNTDNLHRRSGVPSGKIAEVHGNCYLEYCSECKKEFMRPYSVLTTVKDFPTHITGRKCDECDGILKDSIVHFGEYLPTSEYQNSMNNAQKSDLSIVLGSSMRVPPSSKMPGVAVKNGGTMVIVNLQKTQYDDKSKIRVFARTDEFMTRLMKALGETKFDQEFDLLIPSTTEPKKETTSTTSVPASNVAENKVTEQLIKKKKTGLFDSAFDS